MLELLILNVILNHKGNGNTDVGDKDNVDKLLSFGGRLDDFTI